MQRITIHEARKRFATGQAIYVCPCKLNPDGPFSPACLVYGLEYLERAERYQEHSTMWAGSLERTGWRLMMDNWRYYNANFEAGYYPHFYV
jgi:hypothetical protein